jgi:hypothetical protein
MVCPKTAEIAVLSERSDSTTDQLNRIEDNVTKIFSRLDTMTWSALSGLVIIALTLGAYILKLKGW